MWRSMRCLLVTGYSPGDSITRMMGDIAAALEGLGVATEYLCMRHDNIDVEFVNRLLAGLRGFAGPKFLFDFNGKMNPHLPHEGRQLSLIKEFRIPRLVQMLDHPLLQEQYFRHEHFRTAYGVVARHHVAALGAVAPGAPGFYMPHGGPSAPRYLTPPPARDIELLFCANVGAATSRDELAAASGLADPALRPALDGAIGAHIEERRPLSEALADCLAAVGLVLPVTDFAARYAVIERWVVAERRRAVLAALPKDAELMLCGSVPRDLALPERTRVTGLVPFADFLDLLGNARTLVNSRSAFRDGAHERVFYAMSRGTAVLTDGEVDAADAASLRIGSYWLPAEPPGPVLAALAERNAATGPEQLEAERAVYMERHSWTARMSAALGSMISAGLFAP